MATLHFCRIQIHFTIIKQTTGNAKPMWKLEFVIFKIFPEKLKQSISLNPGEVFILESRGGATRGRPGNLHKKTAKYLLTLLKFLAPP